MIEFRLRVDSKITRAIAPLILECFSDCGHESCTDFPYEDEKDADLAESWKSSLRDDMNRDRDSFSSFLQNPKFAHGYVEVEEEEADFILRAITEIRLFIRNHKLESFSDGELETGEFSFGKKSHQTQSYYLAYLILAEVQEGLLQHLS